MWISFSFYQDANIKRVAAAKERQGLVGCGRRKGGGMIGMLGSVLKDMKKRAWLPQGISGNI